MIRISRCLKQYPKTAQLRVFGSSALTFLQQNIHQEKLSLRKVFDDQRFWETINSSNYQHSKQSQERKLKFWTKPRKSVVEGDTGLFQNPYLTSPDGLRRFARKSRKDAEAIVKQLREDTSFDALKSYIIRLDQLSDILCRVIDLCEFIRASHPDDNFVTAAQECHEEMFEIMNVLNTDVVLCNVLKEVLTNESIRKELSSEEIRVGHILLEDFEKSGIYMNPKVRERFIELSQVISIVGQEFITNTEYVGTSFVEIETDVLEASGVSQMVLQQLSKDLSGKFYKIPTYGYLPYSIIRTCPSEYIRKKVWTAMYSCPEKQIKRLKKLVRLRQQLAHIMGKPDYATYQLEGKMAKSPKNVKNFMNTLIEYTKPLAMEELKPLADMKHDNHCKDASEILSSVRPWDRDYFGSMSLLAQPRSVKTMSFQSLNCYFSLGVVIQGLSDLFQSIYGIRLEPVVAKTGETWDPEVRKIQVISEANGVIGVIYCDLFERQGKTPNPAHFTVCCSRQIYPNETDYSTIQVGSHPDKSKFQMPVISLVCNFSHTQADDDSICLLQLSEVETLFHEMGHAMHSMLGRTQLQNISGTRCATDFVELPSILMEHFAKDLRVLSRISSHYATGERVPKEMLVNYQQENRFLEHTETFSQIKMAMLDQRLHSLTDNSEDIVTVYHGLEKELQVLVDDRSNWCGRFGHLFGYGASYYSYLMDRAIAAKVWNHLFQHDPFSRAGGEKFKNSVLKWGGSRDPWRCIADALDEPRLINGDNWAMRYIGEVKNM
ncbi:metalloendopeptidase Ecym_6099 [Eremothecium cymbalariae DBVPG|uniref:Mitochondrial intermediate peptidase n=1 Tax=Eremothecium cymbalariae (strain CBS 270.75 / DBVPG 7215 / KCTC 17166 / NRRL Y-17582) TaxID=931890 RepID=G8JV16_ERECY|nr:hypothetical protein Ecym_6099 [Eremothecium cymbalariae DBVPG\